MHSTESLLPVVHKIAVLRCTALGDFIFALPALDALRAAYPQAEIVLLARPWHAAWLADRPTPVDRVVPVPPSTGVNGPFDAPANEDPSALTAFFDAMRGEAFDLALQLHGGGRYSNPFVRQLGACVTAGLKAPDAVALDRWVPYVYHQPEVLRYLEAVALVGAPPVTLESRLAVTPADAAEAQQVVPPTERPLVVLHPGATHPGRRWPPQSFAALADTLVAKGATVIITGTAAERPLVDAVRSAMKYAAHDACGRLSLGGLGGLMARAQVVIANDTGPLHLAGAVGAATIGIYWCGNVLASAPLTRARHRPLISWRLDCPQCGRDSLREPCGHAVSFVADVSVEEVVVAATEVLAEADARLQA